MSFLDPLLSGVRRIADVVGLKPAEPTLRFLGGFTVTPNPSNASTDVSVSAGTPGTAGQVFVTTVLLASAFVTVSGDIAASTSVPGQFNVASIGSLAGGSIPLGTGTTGVTLAGAASTGNTAPTQTIAGSAGFTSHNGGDLSLIAGAVASTFLSWPTIPVLYYMVHARGDSGITCEPNTNQGELL